MPVTLTIQQRHVYEFVRAYVAQRGVGPSFDEIKDAIDVKAKSTISRLLSGIEERGLIRRVPHRRRAIEILVDMPPMFSIKDLTAVLGGILDEELVGQDTLRLRLQLRMSTALTEFFESTK